MSLLLLSALLVKLRRTVGLIVVSSAFAGSAQAQTAAPAATPNPTPETAKAPAKAEEPKPPTVRYKDGQLSIEFEKGSINLTNRLQLRFATQFPDAATQLPGTTERGANKLSFRIRRYEPQVTGWIYSKQLTYKLELAMQDLQNNAVNGGALNDAYFNYDFTSGKKAFRLQAGQFKAPFGRQELTSSFSLQFVDRSVLAGEYERGRELGAQIDGLLFKQKVEWRAGVFNGNGRGATLNDNGAQQIDARVMFQPWGEVKYSEGDFESAAHPLLAIAAQYERNDYTGVSTVTPLPRVSACPCGVGGVLKSRVLGADLAFKYHGFGLNGVYYSRVVTPLAAGTSRFDSNGYSAEAGYLFGKARRFQAALRYSSWDPTSALGANDRSERGVAVNWFYNRHFAKVQADFRELKDRARRSTDREFRVQTQLSF